jgi:hypothetical protein
VAEFGPGGPSDPCRAPLTLSLGLAGRPRFPISAMWGPTVSRPCFFLSKPHELGSTPRGASRTSSIPIDPLPSGARGGFPLSLPYDPMLLVNFFPFVSVINGRFVGSLILRISNDLEPNSSPLSSISESSLVGFDGLGDNPFKGLIHVLSVG